MNSLRRVHTHSRGQPNENKSVRSHIDGSDLSLPHTSSHPLGARPDGVQSADIAPKDGHVTQVTPNPSIERTFKGRFAPFAPPLMSNACCMPCLSSTKENSM